jgi:serine/threonine-protein kinase RsbW
VTDGDSPTAVELDIPARAENLSLVRVVVAAAAALEPRLREQRIEDLRLAVSEATTNAIEAHAELGSDDRIVIRCDLSDDRIEVEVRDRGEGFDPGTLQAHPPVTDPARLEYERGLGLPLMRVLADETEIRSSDAGTAVRLVVYTSPNLRRDAGT